jgi:hypothetical protein
MLPNAEVKVTYNSYLDDVEMGDLTCSDFADFADFADYVTVCRRVIREQLLFDPNYRDVREAWLKVYLHNELVGHVHFRKERGNGVVITSHC